MQQTMIVACAFAPKTVYELPWNTIRPCSHFEYKVETLCSGTKVGVYILGTQCLNTAPFCAAAQELGHQVSTWP